MKLLNNELEDKIWSDVRDKVNEHAPWDGPIHEQIRKNFGLWGDVTLSTLKIDQPNFNIRWDLNETD